MIEILLKDIKPVSINQAYATARNGGRFNTKKYVEFLNNFKVLMFRYKKIMSEFERNFDNNLHGVNLELDFFIPRKRFFTTQGRVNLRSGDASNFIKTTEDAFFKQFDVIDDANVMSVKSTKRVSYDENFHIKLLFDRVDITLLKES